MDGVVCPDRAIRVSVTYNVVRHSFVAYFTQRDNEGDMFGFLWEVAPETELGEIDEIILDDHLWKAIKEVDNAGGCKRFLFKVTPGARLPYAHILTKDGG